jgi:hypothetical protein
VISDLDIWRAANLMIGRHGADAELEAARMADAMLDHGDIDGQRVWLRISVPSWRYRPRHTANRIEVAACRGGTS